jgi:hypothetical protein
VRAQVSNRPVLEQKASVNVWQQIGAEEPAAAAQQLMKQNDNFGYKARPQMLEQKSANTFPSVWTQIGVEVTYNQDICCQHLPSSMCVCVNIEERVFNQLPQHAGPPLRGQRTVQAERQLRLQGASPDARREAPARERVEPDRRP